MTVLLVPSEYDTITDAVQASVAGDVIVVSAGTYAEQLDLTNKEKLTIRAAFGESVTIRPPTSIPGLFTVCIKLDGAYQIQFRDLTFSAQNAGTFNVFLGYSQMECRNISIVDCFFYGNTNVTQAVIRVGPGTWYRPTVIRRCRFQGSLTPVSRIIRVESTQGGSTLIEACGFSGWDIRTATTWVNPCGIEVVSTVPSSVDTTVIRAVSARQIRLAQRWIYVSTVPAAAKVVIYNCICEVYQNSTVSYSDAVAIQGGGLAVATVQNCTMYRGHGLGGGGFSSLSFSPNTSGNLVTDPELGVSSSYSLGWSDWYFNYNDPPNSNSYHTGVSSSSGGGENILVLDAVRYPFATSPSRGALEGQTEAGKQVLHLKYKNVDITSGLSISFGYELTLTGERRNYEDPFEIGKHLEILINDAQPPADVEFWYDFTVNAYRIQCAAGTVFNVATTGFARFLLGAGTP